MKYPVTPDGRYFVVKGRLWRMSNPALKPTEREALVKELMTARRAVAAARRLHSEPKESAAHDRVNAAKVALGERGPVWWEDKAPDFNRHMVANTPYRMWYETLLASRKDA